MKNNCSPQTKGISISVSRYILIQFYQTQAYSIETYEYFPKQ